ncbi:oligosaccharide flippase family protein [Desulfobacter latus]|uniref:Oligosaccharide flippase family protein n=1 Tax=Desulfobacter latus TaxID=2292 RepID=A0A850T961_9BACT|nr:oligosaccharide flippase family protein [Desulfobacter latus]NWH05028.1 oligosaccharide flippase family protein [Desulfobacter latus]
MSARVHIRNLAFNWGGHVATLLVMFFLSPYIVGKLDAATYGIWSLLNVLTGYMGIFDLGVRASVGRHVALYLGKGDHQGVDETIRAGFGFFTLIGGLILLSGIILGWIFPLIFKGVGGGNYAVVRLLLPILSVNIWISIISSIYSSVLAAHDRFDIARIVDLFVLIVRTILTVWVLEVGWGLWGLTIAILVGNIFALIGNKIFATRVYDGLKTFPLLYSKKRFSELIGYGVPAFISNASVKIIGQSDLVIIGILLSVSDVREYNVGAMLIYYSTTFIVIIGRTFFPEMQRTVAKGKLGEAKHIFYRQLQTSLCFGILMFVGFAFFSKSFIHLWMFQEGFGLESVASAAKIMTILSISKIITLYIAPCKFALASSGQVNYYAKITLMEAVINLIFSIFFVTVLHSGIVGVAFGTLLSRLCVSIIIPKYLLKEWKINFVSYAKKALIPGIISIGLFSITCYLLQTLWFPSTWMIFIVHIILACTMWFIIASYLLIPVEIIVKAKTFFKKRFLFKVRS